jgi:opacity protein-like surface antigen
MLTHVQADGYFFGEVGLRHEVKLTDDLTFEAIFRQSFFRYHSLSALNFNSLNAGAGVFYNPTELWDITLFGRYNFEWNTNSRSSRDLLTGHTLTVGAQKTFA